MTGISAAISKEQSIYAALELSKNSWLLTIQVPCRDAVARTGGWSAPSQNPEPGRRITLPIWRER